MMQPQILEGVRISPLQKHLWLLQHADKQTPFRAQVAVLIEGKLDRDNLNLALKMLLINMRYLGLNLNACRG
ncbi:MAG: hypothetical protein CLLPBCKN_000254 [Chroococcidiopsis cubana SAG 39.79]|uniref:hypothetical protein n=1 Tax=Chroococcidiopsis cubana TaxID=171392 RepID=UPI002AC5DE6B|nr:hypothetical protein [Chroococcidiopsis cubana]MDZ4870866.1 hypothetical protein [Chroococcidiopsis cubana SAG 39.79]